ncbi:MAG: WD40 repeat domain-containing protein [Cyanobacteriota bacterium]|nr:WD40 repeat domain-containing protein [Cyanobacteriota bacterium]
MRFLQTDRPKRKMVRYLRNFTQLSVAIAAIFVWAAIAAGNARGQETLPLPLKPLPDEELKPFPEEELIPFPDEEIAPFLSDEEFEILFPLIEQFRIYGEHDWIADPLAWRSLQVLYRLEGHNSAVQSLVFSPDSQYLVSGGSRNDGYLHVWSMETGEEFEKFRAQQTSVLAMAMSPDGKVVASSGDDANLNLWQWQDLAENYLFLDTHHNILSLLVTPDSQVLITSGLDGIRLWNLRTQKPIYTLVRFDNQINSMAIDPRNGYILRTGGLKGEMQVWNVRTGSRINQFSAHRDKIGVMVFTPDGQRFISGSDDRTVKVWDANNNRLLHTLVGHTGRITAIAIHPNGQFFASASRDGIRLWDIDSGQLIQHWYAHTTWVESLAFSPNGRFLASGGYDRTIKVWQPFLPAELLEEQY